MFLKMGIYIDTPVFLWLHKCAEKDLAMTQCRETVWLTLPSVADVSLWVVDWWKAEQQNWLLPNQLLYLISWDIQCSYKCWTGVSHDLDHEPWECVAPTPHVPSDTKPKTLLGQYLTITLIFSQGDKWASLKLHKIMGMFCNTYRWNHTRSNPHCCMNLM